MKIVIDTNVLLVSISSKSIYRIIFDSLINEEYELYVTTEILFEYEEIFKNFMGVKFAEHVLQLIENAPNVKWVTNYYKWNLIKVDEDDNKFVDCALACGAQYLVSNDKHLSLLKEIPFPKVDVISAKDFKKILLKI